VTVAGGAGGDWSPHVLLLHHHETHRQARVVSWVREGLALGEKILYSSVPGDLLVSVLTRWGADVAPAHRDGQIAVFPSEEVFPGGRQAELVQRALDEGYPGVRLFARADAGLTETDLEEYRALDRLTDELCARLPVTALCQLDAGSASAATQATVIRDHSGVVEDAQMRLSRRGPRLLLRGKVDVSSVDLLRQALGSACQVQTGPTTVLDLSELTFVDVSGCRALVIGTEEHRRADGRMTIADTSGHVHKVLSLLGVDRLPGIEIR
jgi:anti-anti-sigma factor